MHKITDWRAYSIQVPRTTTTSGQLTSRPHAAQIAAVTVHVADVNDNAPIVRWPNASADDDVVVVVAARDVTVGATIARILADDADSGRNAQLDYVIVDESATTDDAGADDRNVVGPFRMSTDDGRVYVAQPLRRPIDVDGVAGTSTVYRLTVAVRDRGTPSLSSTVRLNVVVEYPTTASPRSATADLVDVSALTIAVALTSGLCLFIAVATRALRHRALLERID